MSLRGVRQLQKVIIQYSDIDGSSKGVREWMRKNLVQFAESSPQAEIVTIRARNAHPIIRAHYVNGNKKQIGLKNLESNTVDEHAKFLRNQIGRRVRIISFFFSLFNFCNSRR